MLDASAAVEWLLGYPAARQVADVLRSQGPAHAPELLVPEVAQVLRRQELSQVIDPDRASATVSDLLDLDLTLYRHRPLLRGIWSRRSNLTAYDATYVTLPHLLDVPLLTTGRRLARGARDVEVIVPA